MRFSRLEHQGQSYFGQLIDSETVCLLDGAPWHDGKPTDRLVPLARNRLLAPVTPGKVLCVGRNYAAHAAELGNAVPKSPLLFLKPPSAIIGPGEAILLPPQSERVEHEAELGVVLGARLKNASVDEARDAIFGFTCVNDVTARDLQRAEVQFTRAKGFDTFCPCGPWIETQLDPGNLRVRALVNDETRQDGNTQQMSYPVAELLSFMSGAMTLEPGDLISTGTPAGVGALQDGDLVKIAVEGVGELENPVRSA